MKPIVLLIKKNKTNNKHRVQWHNKYVGIFLNNLTKRKNKHRTQLPNRLLKESRLFNLYQRISVL